MRIAILIIALAFLLFDLSGSRKGLRAAATNTLDQTEYAVGSVSLVDPASARVDFDAQVKPIFQSKCMPCHFSGGQMYERLPFDRPETIRKLGAKLFTRIKDENHRRILREFLEQTE